jgi:hypothetical protein
MATLVEQNDNWVLTFPKNGFPKEFLIRLLDIIRLEELAQRNEMTNEQAWQVSEDIKSSWWEANGAAILAKIQASEG